MEYSEDTAGGIMNTDLISVPSYFSKKEAVEEVIRQSEEVENFYYVYIIDRQDILVGILSLKDLIRAKPFMIMDEIMEKDIITINVHEDQEEVARVIRKYNLPSLPVVDDEGKLLGRITFDDIMDVIEEENTEDLLMIAGVSVDEELRGGWLDAVKSRMPWLLVNLFTASIAGLVIFSFQNVIDRLIILASYMPIIAGVAGNGATQALAVTIRRLSTDSVAKGQFFNVIIKEVLVGLTNGLLIGFCISMVAYFTNSDLRLGLVVFTAMTLNLFIAGLAGSSIPLLFEKLNIDPAIASSIFITAFTDQNLFNFAPTGSEVSAANGVVIIPGTNYKLTAVHGLDGTNRLFSTYMPNFYLGVDMENEEDTFVMMQDQFKDYLRFKCQFKQGVNVAFPDQIVSFKLV
jgi:magnesium transporter